MKSIFTLVFSFLFPAYVHAAFVVVSGTENFVATSWPESARDLDTGTSITTGDFIVVGGTTWHDDSVPTASIAVTSTCSAPLTVVSSVLSTSRRDFIAYGAATSDGICTATVTPADSTYLTFGIKAFRGQNASPLDANPGGANSSTSFANQDITTVAFNALIIGVMGHDGSGVSQTPGASYTEIGENEDNTCCQAGSLVYRIVSTPSTYTVDWTLGDIRAWSSLLLSFKPSVSSGSLARRRAIVQ